jgi:hypothetical protein
MAEKKMELLCVKKNPHIMCMICLEVMNNPYSATCCGKSFCKACIQKTSKCPNCRKTFTIHINRVLRDIIDAEEVYCPHKSEGCKWVGEIGNHKEHLNKSCDWHMTDCEIGCGHKCLGKDMEKHMAEEYHRHNQIQSDHIKRLKTEIQTQIADKHSLNVKSNAVMFSFLLLVAVPVLLGCAYYWLPNQQVSKTAEFPISAPISQVIWMKDIIVWRIDTQDYSNFKMFSAFVQKVNLASLYIKFQAEIVFIDNGSFKASVIVQVLDPTKTYDHHVRRMDVTFVPVANKRNVYTTEYQDLINLDGNDGKNRKFYNQELKVRIVNVEIGLNKHLPLHFSMCHFKTWKENGNKELWKTFPLYINSYKFVIYIYPNGIASSEGKALSMKLYRMKDYEADKSLEDTYTGDVRVKIMKSNGGHISREFSISGRASEGVSETGGEEIEFPANNRFEVKGIRSTYGAEITIPIHELNTYIDNDCLAFYITEPA